MKEMPSREFQNAIKHATSGRSVLCQLCGKTHIVNNISEWEDEKELESFLKDANKNPNKYVVENSFNEIEWGRFDNRQVVVHCPCGHLKKYEDFIWSHRKIIVDYLKSRAKKEITEAQENANLVDGL